MRCSFIVDGQKITLESSKSAHTPTIEPFLMRPDTTNRGFGTLITILSGITAGRFILGSILLMKVSKKLFK